MKRLGLFLLFLLALGAGYFFFVAPARVDASLNKVIAHSPFPMSNEAKALHASLRLADLHDDALLWDRDFTRRSKRGHADAPRLKEGGYRIQVLAAVTKTPKNLNYDRNEANSDNVTPLVIAQRWPVQTWTSLFERARHIARRADLAERSTKGAIIVVRSKSDLAAALNDSELGVILATEGAHPLEGKLENLDGLYDAGYRMIGLHHFFDNELGGSLHGVSGGGLTEFGRAVVAAAEKKGMIIDLAHSSRRVVRETLDATKGPLVVSHTGLYGHCASARNLPDDLMKEIAARGGLIGVGFWDGAVCAASIDAVAEAIVYAVNLLGAEHVALGSDFDGATTTPFDAAEIGALTHALLERGLAPETVKAVMGENAIQFFAAHLSAQ